MEEFISNFCHFRPRAGKLAGSGAVIIFNPSASDEVIGKADYRRTLVKAHSGSMACACAYADCGIGESTQDMVFAGHDIIAENGAVLAESKAFSRGLTIADIGQGSDRRRNAEGGAHEAQILKLAYLQGCEIYNHFIPKCKSAAFATLQPLQSAPKMI